MPHWRPVSVVLLTPLVPFLLLPAIMKPDVHPAVAVGAAIGIGVGIAADGGAAVGIGAGSKLKMSPYFLSQAAIPVVAYAGGDAQVGRHLKLVLDKQPGLLGAIIAARIALQKRRCGKVLRGVRRHPVIGERDKVGRSHHARAGALVAHIQLRIGPASAKAECVPSLGPDGRCRGHDAVLEDAGVGGLICGAGADGKRWRREAIERSGGAVVRVADGVVDGEAGKVVAEAGSSCPRRLRAKRLIVGGVSLFAQNADRLRDAEGGADGLHVVD